jgi:hypothetical protein
VLAGYAGVACGLFAGALACATALVIFFSIPTTSTGTSRCSTGTTVFTRCCGGCSFWPNSRSLGAFTGAGAGAKKGVHAP